jgi:SAM-dependent methyltransferase
VEQTLVDPEALRAEVRAKYRAVAVDPGRSYHFHTGRPLAARLGYDSVVTDALPDEAVESFAGVANPFALRTLAAGERVVDVGSGAGFDSFVAAAQVGDGGRVVGADMTAEMLAKSRATAATLALANVEFREGLAERLPVEDGWADVVISNGVINLSPDKAQVFAAAARLLRLGGRLAVADIVTEQQLTDSIIANADLWASCIGGAAQEDQYGEAIEATGLRIATVRRNPYEFVSTQARNASGTYGVKSISLLAIKPSH